RRRILPRTPCRIRCRIRCRTRRRPRGRTSPPDGRRRSSSRSTQAPGAIDMTAFSNPGGTDDGVIGSTATNGTNRVVGRNDDRAAKNVAIPEGNGVFGTTLVPDGAGVFGLHETGGVGVAGFGHPAGIGVVGASVPPGAKGGDGVLGISNSEHRNGIVGRNDSTAARAAVDAGGNGVFGFTQVPHGAGVVRAHPPTRGGACRGR